MKVWLLTSEYGGKSTHPIGHYVAQLAPALRRKKVEIAVITQASQDYHDTAGDFPVIGFASKYYHPQSGDCANSAIGIGTFPYNLLSYWPALSHQLADVVEALMDRMGPPDLIECQEYGALPYFLIHRKLIGNQALAKVPILVHCHGPSFLLAEANHEPVAAFPQYWVGEMEKFCMGAADALVAPSHFLARQVVGYTGGRNKMEVIPYAAPSAATFPERRAPESSPTVLYVGSLEIRSGILRALQAMEALWDSGEDFRVVLAGNDTNYTPRNTTVAAFIRSRYASQIQNNRLRIFTHYSKEDQHFAAADIVIVPSLWDAFPSACVDALSAGRIVLASVDGAQSELMGANNALLFDWGIPGDFAAKLVALFKMSLSEKEAMAGCARARVSKYCCEEKIIAQRLKNYERVIAEHKKPAFFPATWPDYQLPTSLQSKASLFETSNLEQPGSLEQPSSEGEKALLPLKNQPIFPPEKNQAVRLSVVIPYYNLGKYIKETVESVFRSTVLPDEVFIVDDCSTGEENCAVLQELESHYPSVRVIRHATNRGLATSRNTGAKAAQGEFIAFLDADDEVESTFFEKALPVFEAYPNVGFVYSWVQTFGNSTATWPTWNAHFPYLLGHNMLCANCLVRRGAFLEVGGNNPQFEYSLEDYECWIHLLKQGWLGVSLPECLVRCRVRTGSMFRSATREQFRYLYDLLVQTHSGLYAKWGGELAQLQAANGTSLLWDHPSREYSQTDAEYLRTVEKQRDSLSEEVQALHCNWEKQTHYIQKQHQETTGLKHFLLGNRTSPPLLATEDSYVEFLTMQKDLLQMRLSVAHEMLAAQHPFTWQNYVAAQMLRRICKWVPLHFIFRQTWLLKIVKKFL